MELTITLRDNSRAAQIIENTAEAEHVSREEAAARLLETLPFARRNARVISADRYAAVEAGLGFAKGNDWIVEDFNAEKQADIERDNARGLCLMARSVLVFDASAVVTYLKARPGVEVVTAQMLDPNIEICLHRQNAAEVWCQMHRQGALIRFLATNTHRVAPDSRPNLTDAEFTDFAIFDTSAGERFADEALARVEGTGVQSVGDEMFSWPVEKLPEPSKANTARVSLADCFGISLALALNAPFWTSDRHELQVIQDANTAQIRFFR